MKVNISGKGVIPIINTVAPVYNIEVSEDIIKKLIKNPKFRVYASDGFGQITAATFNPPAPVVEEKAVVEEASKPKKPTNKANKVVEAPKLVEEEKVDVVEETLPEITEEVVTEEKVAEPVPVAEVEELEIPVEETDLEAFPAEEVEEEVSEETTTEAAPVQSYKKKNKKNRK